MQRWRRRRPRRRSDWWTTTSWTATSGTASCTLSRHSRSHRCVDWLSYVKCNTSEEFGKCLTNILWKPGLLYGLLSIIVKIQQTLLQSMKGRQNPIKLQKCKNLWVFLPPRIPALLLVLNILQSVDNGFHSDHDFNFNEPLNISAHMPAHAAHCSRHLAGHYGGSDGRTIYLKK